ncbi:hypothetical protein [Kitasatospora sp. NPDC056273]|uniref:hypothetical protein n=1 Tax=Kitasatospora sp. NPDC056273 TaxID=3345769 RepID=UPI0035D7F8B7
MAGFRVNPQDLRDASKSGYAVAKGIQQDWAEAFGHAPPALGLPNWSFEGAAQAALHDLGEHIDRITTRTLAEAAGNLSIIARSYENTDNGAALTVDGAGAQTGTGGQD